MRHESISIRLTVVFAVVMACVLGAGSLFVYVSVGAAIDRGIQSRLKLRWNDVRETARAHPQQLQTPLQLQTLLSVSDGPAQAYSPAGARIASTRSVRYVHLQTAAEARRLTLRARNLGELGDDRYARYGGRPVANGPGVVVAADLSSRNEAQAKLATELIVASITMLCLSTLIAYVLNRRVLAPVEQLRQQAADIAAGDDRSLLVVPDTGDEIARLAETLNNLLDQLHRSVDRERQFVVDAGHELRTPLALLAAEIELALEQPDLDESQHSVLTSLQEETQRLARLAERLLALGTMDAGSERADVSVATTLTVVRDRFARTAADLGRALVVNADEDLVVSVPPDLFDLAVSNLVENAFVHGAGDVTIAATAIDGGVMVRVEDDGPGIADDFRARAFDRFARADSARTSPGSGLGLSMVRSFAFECGGRVGADSLVLDASGDVVTRAGVWMWLPRA